LFFYLSNMRKLQILCFTVLFLVNHSFAYNTELIKNGIWQGTLLRPDGKNVIFNFEVREQNGKQVLYVINADERLLVDDIENRGDSLWIHMPYFASSFSLNYKTDGKLEGFYIKNYGSRVMTIPFKATHGISERYPVGKSKYNISGRWQVAFLDGDKSTPAIGEFEQSADGKVTGTFLTTTGDYRFLEGSVKGDSLNLSGFDGGHVLLFTAKIRSNSALYDAYIYSGLSTPAKWTAIKNAKATLPDGYGVTKMREGETKLNFKFRSTNGDTVSISDPKYAGKVVVVQILGSWCPNCLDETEFLSSYYTANKQRGVEVIGIAYERTTDFESSVKALAPFQKRLNVQYPFLVANAAVSDPLRVEKTLPQLTKIEAFPTSIFIDKKGEVRKIHSGYDGPATGKHYEAFKKEFEAIITQLLNE
jgi:peroxiredoxin